MINFLRHQSAKASHYNKDAENYDAFNDENSKVINKVIENILRKHGVKSVLDLTCGTGAQVFWLTERGFDVIGSDINAKMLTLAKKKAKKANLGIKFIKGDMRTVQLGNFDAVISVFNAVGHLTKSDFEKSMRNIHRNLKEGGIYIFDINNLSYLLKDDNITTLTIDWQRVTGNFKIRDIQYSTISCDGILSSYDTIFVQTGTSKAKVSTSAQTLQVYSAKQLKEMLSKNGFKVVGQFGVDGKKFFENKSDRVLTIAKKVASVEF